MKSFMAIINIAIFIITTAFTTILLITSEFGAAWLMVVLVLYSGGNFLAIVRDE